MRARLTWNYFVEVLLRGQTVFLEQANMLMFRLLDEVRGE